MFAQISMRWIIVSALCLPLATAQPVMGALNVSAKSDLWRAGGFSFPTDLGPGSPPPYYAFPAKADQVITFTKITGSWSCGFQAYGPEGAQCGGFVGLSIRGVGGMSGIADLFLNGFLVGMFLEDANPPLTSPAPRMGDVPGIGEVFKIGNGLGSDGKPIRFLVPPTATRLFLGFPDQCGAGQVSSCYHDNYGSVAATSCLVSVDRSIGLDATAMFAAFTPAGGLSLTDAASACGFIGFDWMQKITHLPSPSPFFAAFNSTEVPDATQPIVIPPLSPIHDGPPGGYTYLESQLPPFLGAFPFYYNPSVVSFGCFSYRPDLTCARFITEGNTLNFGDGPIDPCLPDGAGVGKAPCAFKAAPPDNEAFLGFTTSLVGVLPGNAPGPDLYDWPWTSSNSGSSGFIVAQTQSSYFFYPTSGTGGITITGTNGVPYVSPIVSCKATPNTLWPPNGRSVLVTVTGNITGGQSGLNSGTARYWVIDEYGEIRPRGSITLGVGGSYSFGVSLIAARDGNHQDGRTYTIIVGAQDNIGSLGSCSAIVTVPHDQGK